ncbi:hypothetical protein BT69DRAFT_1321261 [Atractiella rhizophila]|nr:hypothetical protein BT69DRAFT_1321261 [Atractiella rhizophila]
MAEPMHQDVEGQEKPPLMRKSCKFCRSRKIRCSGEQGGCAACVGRKQECVYEAAAPMGRPRKYPRDEKGQSRPSAPPKKPSLLARRVTSGLDLRALSKNPDIIPLPTSPPLPISIEDLERGMSKLRLEKALDDTFNSFEHERIGVLVKAQFYLVSPDALPINLPKYRAHRSTRFLYEVALRARTAKRATTKVTMDFPSRLRLLWNLGVDLVSWFTWGCSSKCDPAYNEPAYLRWLQNDNVTPFPDIEQEPVQDPLKLFSKERIIELLTKWFIWNPSSFYCNDAEILRQVNDDTIDPALLCAILGSVLDFAPSGSDGTKAPSPPSNAASPIIDFPDRPSPLGSKFFAHAQRLLFHRTSRTGALKLSTLQAMIIWCIREVAFLEGRRAWALNSSTRVLGREALKQCMARKAIGLNWGEKDELEMEMIINICWVNASWGSWTFLALGMPKATMLEVTAGLPLPPSDHIKSASYQYRLKHAHLPLDEKKLQEAIQRFSERARTISLIFTLETKGSRPPPSSGPLDQATFDVHVAKWLVDSATSLFRDFLVPSSEEDNLSKSPYLCCIHCIMALHRLHPFTIQQRQSLPPQTYSLCIRALDLLFRSSTPLLSLHLKETRSPTIEDRNTLVGIVRLVADALPACYAIMRDLVSDAQPGTNVFSLLISEESKISGILRNMNVCYRAGMDIEPPERGLDKVAGLSTSIELLRATPAEPLGPESSPESDHSAQLSYRNASTTSLNTFNNPSLVSSWTSMASYPDGTGLPGLPQSSLPPISIPKLPSIDTLTNPPPPSTSIISSTVRDPTLFVASPYEYQNPTFSGGQIQPPQYPYAAAAPPAVTGYQDDAHQFLPETAIEQYPIVPLGATTMGLPRFPPTVMGHGPPTADSYFPHRATIDFARQNAPSFSSFPLPESGHHSRVDTLPSHYRMSVPVDPASHVQDWSDPNNFGLYASFGQEQYNPSSQQGLGVSASELLNGLQELLPDFPTQPTLSTLQNLPTHVTQPPFAQSSRSQPSSSGLERRASHPHLRQL